MENRGLAQSIASLLIVLVLASCTSKNGHYADIPDDSLTVASGQEIFAGNCSACHNFRQDGIGPQLGGVTEKVSADWLRTFIKNPQAMVDAGDDRGVQLVARYKTMMPAFAHLSDEQVTNVIAFLHTQEAPAPASELAGVEELKNPLPEPITQSNLVVGVEFVTELPASSDKGFKTRITKYDYIPGSQRMFMVDIRGKLYEIKNNKPHVYMDMAQLNSKFIDSPGLATGFGSFAFHPEFLKNGLLYTSHTESPAAATPDFGYADSIKATVQWVISEWKTDQPGSPSFKGKSRELFRINMVGGIHGVQELTFNPNSKKGDDDYGLLHIGIGDGGSVELGFPFLVQNIERPWGSILRIDPSGKNSRNGKYGIPPSNPFVQHENKQAVQEIYAYGFRNPHRITWSRAGLMLASNIGQANIESVNLVQPGHNYGWPIREGTFMINPYGDLKKAYPLPADDDQFGITYPAAQYDHDEGLAISGGFEYTADAIPALRGKYLFADMNNGRLYYINLADIKPGKIAKIYEWRITFNGRPTTTSELHGSKRVDLRFGKDANGDVYIFSKQDGKVYRLATANGVISGL